MERALRSCLKSEGFNLSRPKEHGETGVDLIAQKGNRKHYIEMIGFQEVPPVRSKQFYEIFFRAVSRLKDGAQSIVIALPERFGNGLNRRASQYGEAWERIGNAFPELEIWLVVCARPYSYRRTRWNDWLT
jgi:uncharacterized protein involved in tellurium resistance